MQSVQIDKDERQMILNALDEMWRRIDRERSETNYPYDQPLITKQIAVSDLMTKLRTGQDGTHT